MQVFCLINLFKHSNKIKQLNLRTYTSIREYLMLENFTKFDLQIPKHYTNKQIHLHLFSLSLYHSIDPHTIC